MFQAFMDNLGVILALAGAALSVLMAGIGSAWAWRAKPPRA